MNLNNGPKLSCENII